MSDKKSAVIDLASLDTAALCEQGAELELTGPGTGEPLGVYLTLAGMDSRVWRRAANALAEKRTRQRHRVTADEVRTGTIEILARCTLGWRHVVVDGQELPCNVENARELYSRFPWICEQADAFCSDRGSFLGE